MPEETDDVKATMEVREFTRGQMSKLLGVEPLTVGRWFKMQFSQNTVDGKTLVAFMQAHGIPLPTKKQLEDIYLPGRQLPPSEGRSL